MDPCELSESEDESDPDEDEDDVDVEDEADDDVEVLLAEPCGFAWPAILARNTLVPSRACSRFCSYRLGNKRGLSS